MATQLPLEIVAYCRVSHKDSATSGLGMEAQRAAIAQYATQLGATVVARYEEVETARRPRLDNRPELQRALAHARRSGARLVIARLDRLARNVFVTAQLLESGVDFVACDNPHANRLTIHILAAMAEHESRMTSARIRDAFAAARARGVVFRPGVWPAGAQQKGCAISAELTRRRTKALYADLVPIVVQLRDLGYSHLEVATELNRQGHRNQRKRPWTVSNVRALLTREGFVELRHRRSDRVPSMPSISASRAAAKAAYAAFTPEVMRRYRAGESASRIAVWLNDAGHRTSKWGRWTGESVRDLLRRGGVALRMKGHVLDAEAMRLGVAQSVAAREKRREASYRVAGPIARRMRRAGHRYVAIADDLNNRGILSTNGHRWNANLVLVMLQRLPGYVRGRRGTRE